MEQDLIDGCSYVELPDCPSDVFHFLSAPYDGLYEFYSEKGQVVSDRLMFHLTDTFKTLSRLASLLLYVYQPNILLSIFDNVISRVDTDWPSTLCGWDFRERRSTDEYGQYVPREICLHPISVIELALDMNLPSILPAALYDPSRYSPSKIMLRTYSPPTAFELLLSQSTNQFDFLVICYVGFSAVAKLHCVL